MFGKLWKSMVVREKGDFVVKFCPFYSKIGKNKWFWARNSSTSFLASVFFMSWPHTDPWFIPWIFQIPFRIRGDFLIRKLFPGVWYPAEEKKNFGLGDSLNPKYYNLGYCSFNRQTNLKKGLCKGTDKLSKLYDMILLGHEQLVGRPTHRNKFLWGIIQSDRSNQISAGFNNPYTQTSSGYHTPLNKFLLDTRAL